VTLVLTNGPRLDLDEHWRVEHFHPVAEGDGLITEL